MAKSYYFFKCHVPLGHRLSTDSCSLSCGNGNDFLGKLFPIAFKMVFNLILFLDWLPSKAKELCLSCYLAHSWHKRWVHAFLEGINANMNATDSAGIWTLMIDFNFCDSNHYTSHTYELHYVYYSKCYLHPLPSYECLTLFMHCALTKHKIFTLELKS